MARPTKYTEELAKKICERIAEGESVRSISRDEDMPHQSTIFDWAMNHPEFSVQYDKARDIGMEVRAEEIEEIAQTEEDTARAKLIIDTKKWNMSKLKPKRFGDRLTAVTEDKDGKTIPISGMVIMQDGN
jgi:transposase-like protein